MRTEADNAVAERPRAVAPGPLVARIAGVVAAGAAVACAVSAVAARSSRGEVNARPVAAAASVAMLRASPGESAALRSESRDVSAEAPSISRTDALKQDSAKTNLVPFVHTEEMPGSRAAAETTASSSTSDMDMSRNKPTVRAEVKEKPSPYALPELKNPYR